MAVKIERKYIAHMIDQDGGGVNDWYWLGDDMSEYNVELNVDVAVEKDILGNEYVHIDSFDPEASADSFYARIGDAMFMKLQSIIDNIRTNGPIFRTYALDVKMWGEPQWGGITGAPSSKNPKRLGWYEKVNNVYVPSSDTSAVSTKTYYYKQFPAIRRRCCIIPQKYGGDTSGYQIPFTVKYYYDSGHPDVNGLYDVSENKFNISE